MVFGLFSKGTMNIQLQKMAFSQGESISGTVTMQLKKPIQARGVRICLIGEQKTTQYRNGKMETSTQQIFNLPVQLDSEKEYTTQPYSYNFELKAPQISNNSSLPGGAAGTAIKAVGFLMNGTIAGAGAVSWFIDASLDVPKGFDVSKKLQISLA